MQRPLEISHTLTVLSIEDDAMYWLFVEKSKSEKRSDFKNNNSNMLNIDKA